MIPSVCRSLSDYAAMFALDETDLADSARILDVGSGGATFASEAAEHGARVTACDPIFALAPSQLLRVLRESLERVLTSIQTRPEEYLFEPYGTPAAYTAHRRRTYRRFKTEYLNSVSGRGRRLACVAAVLPSLPFRDQEFDLVLSSHVLFSHTDEIDQDMHVAAIREMARVGREVRVFPLQPAGGRNALDVERIVGRLEAVGSSLRRQKTGYQMRKGANEMLVVRS